MSLFTDIEGLDPDEVKKTLLYMVAVGLIVSRRRPIDAGYSNEVRYFANDEDEDETWRRLRHQCRSEAGREARSG